MINDLGSGQQEEKSDRPLFVKSQNLRNSKVLKFPDEPPTDRQIKYLIKLGYSGVVPKDRKTASDIIADILKPKEI